MPHGPGAKWAQPRIGTADGIRKGGVLDPFPPIRNGRRRLCIPAPLCCANKILPALPARPVEEVVVAVILPVFGCLVEVGSVAPRLEPGSGIAFLIVPGPAGVLVPVESGIGIIAVTGISTVGFAEHEVATSMLAITPEETGAATTSGSLGVIDAGHATASAIGVFGRADEATGICSNTIISALLPPAEPLLSPSTETGFAIPVWRIMACTAFCETVGERRAPFALCEPFSSKVESALSLVLGGVDVVFGVVEMVSLPSLTDYKRNYCHTYMQEQKKHKERLYRT